MTLDEAIKHADERGAGNSPCAADHKQLAAWLRELRDQQQPSAILRTPHWWALCLAHNWLIHPLLPLADLLSELGERRVSELIYWLHDSSYPDGGG